MGPWLVFATQTATTDSDHISDQSRHLQLHPTMTWLLSRDQSEKLEGL